MSGDGAPTYSIVVPTFRRPQALRVTVEAIAALDYPRERLELIVVDDEGEGAAGVVLTEIDLAGVELHVESQRRAGAAAARNRGARRASRQVLLFIDDDILIAPDHLERHARVGARYERPLVNAAWEFTPEVLAQLARTPFGRFRVELERGFQTGAAGTPQPDGCVEMAMLGSWDLALERRLFWELGGFDEAFPVAGAEDQDLSLRARAAGCRLLLDPAIRVLHNDDRLDLAAYCAREERSAQTMPHLARKHPAQFGEVAYVRENRPIERTDRPALIVKKALKAALATGPGLALAHRLARLGEALGLSDRVLRRIYRGLLGLHLYRGFRRSWGR